MNLNNNLFALLVALSISVIFSTLSGCSDAVDKSTIPSTPNATLESIAITPSNPSIDFGSNSQQFIATGTYSDDSQQDLTAQVTWSSNNTGVATVSNISGIKGLATRVATGTAEITAVVPELITISDITVLTVTDVAKPNGCYDLPGKPFLGGPLCGPATRPCKLLEEQTIDPVVGFRNGAPAVSFNAACEPRVIYSLAEGGFQGYLARRTGTQWTSVTTSFDVATVSMAYNISNQNFDVLTYDGAFVLSRRTFDSMGSWTDLGALVGKYLFSDRGVASSGYGELYTTLVTDTYNAVTAGFNGTNWSYETLIGNVATISTGAAIGVTGIYNSFWSSAGGNGWELYWKAPGTAPQPILTNGNVLTISLHDIEILADENSVDQPWIFHGLEPRRLVLSTLVGGVWTTQDVALTGVPSCPAATLGATCSVDYTNQSFLGAVSNNTEIRMLYISDYLTGQLIADCSFLPCFWDDSLLVHQASLNISWPNGNQVDTASLPLKTNLRSGQLAVDAFGRIHIAGYALKGGGTTVEYLVVGP